MCSQKCANPESDRGSCAAPTAVVAPAAVVFAWGSCTRQIVTPFDRRRVRKSLQSASPFIGVGRSAKLGDEGWPVPPLAAVSSEPMVDGRMPMPMAADDDLVCHVYVVLERWEDSRQRRSESEVRKC